MVELLHIIEELTTPLDSHLSEPWATLVGTPLTIVVTLVVAVLVRWLLHRAIDRLLRNTAKKRATREALLKGTPGQIFATTTGYRTDRYEARIATLASLGKSTVSIVVFGTALLTILEVLGLPLAPLLASASVGGLAIGFGAQSLVRDFLSGVFMIAEDQYGVGDTIDTGSVVGTVEEVTLRITRLRDGDGTVWYVRNGEIQRIGNRSQGYSMANVDIPVGYTEDISRVTDVLGDALASLYAPEGARDDGRPEWVDQLVDEPTVAGLESMTGGSLTVRVSARCRPNEKDAVQRQLRVYLRAALADAGVAVRSSPV